ncbi:MAG: hypothetical protein ACTJLN_04340 [Rickettsia amblyommatis]
MIQKTGKPIKYEEVLDWSRIEYNPKDNTLINKALDIYTFSKQSNI